MRTRIGYFQTIDTVFCTGDSSRDRCTVGSIELHTNPVSYTNPGSHTPVNVCVSELSASVTDMTKSDICPPNDYCDTICPPNVCTSVCNSKLTSVHVQTQEAECISPSLHFGCDRILRDLHVLRAHTPGHVQAAVVKMAMAYHQGVIL